MARKRMYYAQRKCQYGPTIRNKGRPVPQGCINIGCHFAWATKFIMMVTNIYGSSVWILFLVTFMASRISRWLLYFLTIGVLLTLVYVYFKE